MCCAGCVYFNHAAVCCLLLLAVRLHLNDTYCCPTANNSTQSCPAHSASTEQFTHTAAMTLVSPSSM